MILKWIKSAIAMVIVVLFFAITFLPTLFLKYTGILCQFLMYRFNWALHSVWRFDKKLTAALRRWSR